MSIIRIPVSLKLDTDTDFYTNCVARKRDDRVLSEFIVGIMKAYHENPHIKEAVDEVMDANTPFAAIRKQIERIGMEHNKTIMSTAMLSQHIQTSKEKYEGAEVVESGGSGEDVDTGKVLGRLEALEKSMPDINDKLNAVLNLLQSGAVIGTVPSTMSSPAPFQPTEHAATIAIEQPQTAPSTVQKVVFEQQSPNPVTNPVIKSAPTFAQPTVESSSQPVTLEIPIGQGTEQLSATPSLVIIASEDEPEAEVKPNRPASFGKLKSSLTKKEA